MERKPGMLACAPSPVGAEAVSVIVPCWNARATLDAALRSIVEQEVRPEQVILVDDGSTDGSTELAAGFPDVTVLTLPRRGDAAARNAGLGLATGALIAFLDADDVWLPGALRVQREILAGHPEAGVAVARQEFFLDPGSERPGWFRPELLQGDHPGMHLGAFLIRRAVFDRVGVFDESFPVGSDGEWMFRVRDAGIPMIQHQHLLFRRRICATGLSSQVPRMHADLLRMAAESIARKRAGSPGSSAPGEGSREKRQGAPLRS